MTYEAQLLPFAQSENQEEDGSRATGLAELLLPYSALLFRVAHSVVRNRQEAEDVVQETFLRVLRQPSELATIRDLRVWLVRICWRLSIDRRRRLRPVQLADGYLAELPGAAVPADQALAASEQMRRVLAAIDTLPAPERSALLLSALEELDTRAVADILGRSPSAIRALLSRARTHLHQRLGERPGPKKRKETFR